MSLGARCFWQSTSPVAAARFLLVSVAVMSRCDTVAAFMPIGCFDVTFQEDEVALSSTGNNAGYGEGFYNCAVYLGDAGYGFLRTFAGFTSHWSLICIERTKLWPRVDNSLCNTTCIGDSTQTCGSEPERYTFIIASCSRGYYGYGCQSVCPCNGHSCFITGDCSVDCPPGFSGLMCDEDVDECLAKPCSHNCTNTIGSFVCSCPQGLILDADGRTCKGPPCSSPANNDCQQNCIYQSAACQVASCPYTCSCNAPYTLDKNGRTCSTRCDTFLYWARHRRRCRGFKMNWKRFYHGPR